jgi:hypothetical protein
VGCVGRVNRTPTPIIPHQISEKCSLYLSQVIALYNGGAPGVIYEFIAVSVFYWMIAACIAEMASASPSSAGVYQWASITAGKHGRIVGYFAGWYVISGLLKHLATTNTSPYWNRIEVLDLVLVFAAAATQEGDFRVQSHGDMDLGRGHEIDGELTFVQDAENARPRFWILYSSSPPPLRRAISKYTAMETWTSDEDVRSTDKCYLSKMLKMLMRNPWARD